MSLGTAPEPAAREMRTGDVGEADEATAGRRSRRDRRVRATVVERDGLVRDRRRQRAPAGQLSPSPCVPTAIPLGAGTWVEVRGVLGQETSGSKPNEGYRVWPRAAIGGAGHRAGRRWSGSAGGPEAGSGGGGSGGSYGGPTGSLDDLGTADLSRLRIGATLVVGPWKEMRVGGLLWDGARLVAVHPSSGSLVARLTRERRPPFALDLGGLQAAGSDAGDRCAGGQARVGGRPDDSSRCRSRRAASRARRRSPGLGLGRRSAFGAGHASRARGRWRAGRPPRPLRGRRPASTRWRGGGHRRRDRGSAAAARPLRRHAHRPERGRRRHEGRARTAAPKRPRSDDRRRPPWPRLRTCDDRSSPASSWRRRSPSWAARPSDGDAHPTPSAPEDAPELGGHDARRRPHLTLVQVPRESGP